jgi:hypothetical protein
MPKTNEIVDLSHYSLYDRDNCEIEPAAGDYGSKDYRQAIRDSLDCPQAEGWVESPRYGRVYADRCR